MCDSYNHRLVLIKTIKGKKFGGYAYQNWEGKEISKVDNRAFYFLLIIKKYIM